MKKHRQRMRDLRDWRRRNANAFTHIMLHGITVIVFMAMYLSLDSWLPANLQASDVETSVQLLGQVLAVVVGVLLVGTTVSLSSYGGADALAEIHAELASSTEPFFVKFFAGGSVPHKLNRREYRRQLLLRPHVEKLLFSPLKVDAPDEGWFIYRPQWDGAWYQVANSPFYHSNRTGHQLAQVQALHEAVICANKVLNVIAEFRESGSALLGVDNGTNGTRWFIESFEKFRALQKLKLPPEMTLHEAVETVSVALDAEHYMREEFGEHSENIDWSPFVLTTFQIKYYEYLKATIHLIMKLQSLRWVNVVQRHPSMASKHAERVTDLLWMNELNKVQRAISELHGKIVSAHGAAKYFYNIKRWSIPGIGMSLLVLVGLLCGWPYLKWAATPATRAMGFIVLYSAGIASLVESSTFLLRLLWKRRAAG